MRAAIRVSTPRSTTTVPCARWARAAVIPRVFDMMFVDGPYNDCEINWNMAENPPYCGILTTGGDPYAYFKPVDFAINWETLKSITFSFEYMTDATTDRFRDAGFYFVVDGSIDPTNISSSGTSRRPTARSRSSRPT